MNVDDLLDQLIRSGRELAQTARDKGENLADKGNAVFEDFAEEKLGIEANSDAGLAVKGAAAGAALLVLLGTRGGRALTGSALKVGSLAALGGLAYKTWQDWQVGQEGEAQRGGTPVGELEGAQAQTRAQYLLLAMVAAANVDEAISQKESARLAEAFQRIKPDGNVEAFLSEALATPPSIADLAGAVDSPTFGAEMYLAAASVLDTTKPADRKWLDELGKELDIADALAAELLLGLHG